MQQYLTINHLSSVWSLLSFVLSLVSVVCGLPTAPLHLSRTLYKSATFYAKQTQYQERSNEHKPFYDN